MFRNYLKTALRSLANNKGFSVINIAGLAIGLATCLLLTLYVIDELGYDRHFQHAGRIYRLNNEVKFGENHFDLAQSPPLLGPEIVQAFPQVEQFARLRWHDNILIRKGNVNLRETAVVSADSTLFEVLSLPLIAGNPHTALRQPGSIVITESAARKYFNNTDVVGKTLELNNQTNYRITAVIKNIPAQTHFNYDFFLPMMEDPETRNQQSWFSHNYNTYILLGEGADPGKIAQEINKLLERRMGPLLENIIHTSLADFKKQGNFTRCSLIPLTDIHLHSNRIGELGPNSSITFVYIFAVIALFILLIACANFMNLTTARSASRAKEIGVRKVLGSFRKNLVVQFLTESLLVSAVSLLIAVMMVIALLPWFNNLSEKNISINLLFHPSMLALLLGLALLVGLLAGSYPAFFLSAFQPVSVLKGKLASGLKGAWLRNSLVVFQFVVSIVLIIGTLVIYNQLMYIQQKDIGFEREQVLTIQNTNTMGDRVPGFRDELKNLSGVQDVTMTGYLPVNGFRNNDTYFTSPVLDHKTAIAMQIWTVDERFIPTFNMKLLKGRNFSADMPSDSAAVIINEAAARLLGTTDCIDRKLYSFADIKTRKLNVDKIIGVVKNFNFNSLRDEVTPLALILRAEHSSISLRFKTADMEGLLAQIKNKWQSFAPAEPFNYTFVDQEFNNLYKVEQRTGKVVTTFSILAVLIACLGLFGLSMYAAQQRTKEIGIRKVLGASVSNIAAMLSKDFLKLVLIAAVIAFPLAGWAMHKWLEGFAYRVNINAWIFVLAGVMALITALLTISYQALRAAMANPVNSLKAD